MAGRAIAPLRKTKDLLRLKLTANTVTNASEVAAANGI